MILFLLRCDFKGVLGQGNKFFTDEAWRQNVYGFTGTTFGHGTMIMFQAQSVSDKSISANKLQLVKGACNNAMLTPNFNKLISNHWYAFDFAFAVYISHRYTSSLF